MEILSRDLFIYLNLFINKLPGLSGKVIAPVDIL